MRTYLARIKNIQTIALGVSLCILAFLPPALALAPDAFTETLITKLYLSAHIALIFVMSIRPLADIFMGVPFIRPLVILRKGFGVLAASITLSFTLAKILIDPSGYFASLASPAYWSLTHLVVFAHLADLSAFLLLITSNNFSKKVLGLWWKRVQRLSYVFFYGSATYVFVILGDTLMGYAIALVTLLTATAYLMNRARARKRLPVVIRTS